MFAFHQTENGSADYVGEIFSEANGIVRLQVIDAIIAVCAGGWNLTNKIVEIPKSECQFFLDEMSCLEEASRINSSIYDGKILGIT